MEQLDYDLLLCQLLAFVIEVSLLGDVIEVEWVRVGLVRGRRVSKTRSSESPSRWLLRDDTSE